MSGNLSLFTPEQTGELSPPLAELLRPNTWSEVEGLQNLEAGLIRQLSTGSGALPSLIFWGPPGSGKTTLAKLIGKTFDCRFVELSAVLSGVKDIRAVVDEAKLSSKKTILFVDEIHRFNRGQQDAFLPHVEKGTLVLIGATTENPSFYLNAALLSRAKVVRLEPLAEQSLLSILKRGQSKLGININEQGLKTLARVVDGDARRGLNLLEAFVETYPAAERKKLGEAELTTFLKDSKTLRYDRSGEEHYNTVSAFIKSMRGSNADAALFWCFKMLEAGDDPRFVIRRMIIFASEDIGNADPRALQLAVSTMSAYETLGLPEGKIPIAQCVTYLATAPKSNRSYSAMKKVIAEVHACPEVKVPLHLRNAPTGLMESLGYGQGYQYPHDSKEGFVAGVDYLPEQLRDKKFYEPSERGYEKNITERINFLKSLAKTS